VRRYVITPTEPMSYLVGQSRLMELRAEASRRLGGRFDLYRFHGELLAWGTIPPMLLKDELWERLGVG
jgi:uncharacterized protein (DUF885 family)